MNTGGLWFVVLVSILQSTVTAVAPGDEQTFCTVTLPTMTSHPPPVQPPNSRTLMDSYNYVNLLPPQDNPAWQEVDTDMNNVPGRGTEWTQNSGSPCRQVITACGFREGPQNNWLITQYINRTVSSIRLSQVSVLVVFSLTGCSSGDCAISFLVSRYETSTVDNVMARNTMNYQVVNSVASGDVTGLTEQNLTSYINFNTSEDGFYLAITDDTTCISVSRVIVFYNVCPGGVEELVTHPETIAPPVGRVEVMAQCVAGASPENGEAAILNCLQGGVWTTIVGSGCVCDPEFQMSEDGQSCAACPIGMYLSVVNQECRVCPANSMSNTSGLSACPCEDDYYRLPGEEDLPCISRGEITTRGDTATRGDITTRGDTATRGDTTTRGDTATRGDTTTRGLVISTAVSVLEILLLITAVIVIFFSILYFKRKKKIKANATGDNHTCETVSNSPPQNSSPVVPLAENVSSGQQSWKLENSFSYEKSQVESGSEIPAARSHLQPMKDVSHKEPEAGVVLKHNVAYNIMKLQPACSVHRDESEHEVTGISVVMRTTII